MVLMSDEERRARDEEAAFRQSQLSLLMSVCTLIACLVVYFIR